MLNFLSPANEIINNNAIIYSCRICICLFVSFFFIKNYLIISSKGLKFESRDSGC